MASGESSLDSNGSGGGGHGFSGYTNNSPRDCEPMHPELIDMNNTLRRKHSRCDHVLDQLEYYKSEYMGAMNQLTTAAQETSNIRSQCTDITNENRRLQQKVIHLEKKLSRIIESMKLENGNSQTICAFLEQYNELKKKFESNCIDYEKLTKENELCKKLCNELTEDRNSLALEKDELKRELLNALKQIEIVQSEKILYREARDKIIKQHEDAMKVLEVRSKELKLASEERNAAEVEVQTLLSERGNVLKENQKLYDDLASTEKDLSEVKNRYKDEKQNLIYENESLKRDLDLELRCRNDILKECEILREKLKTEKSENRDLIKSRTEFRQISNENWSKDLTESKDKFSLVTEQRILDLETANQEIERLRKSLDKARTETTKAQQETEEAKGRRDWAISEREKIVQERESVKTLCDELRKERDNAISDLLAAIRDSENIKKQKDEAVKDVEQLKEQFEAQMSLANRNARWSYADFDNDLHQFNTEVIDIDMTKFQNDGDLGLVLNGGRDDSQNGSDNKIYVLAVAKDSIFDGKIKINDCIIQVNNLDCMSVTKRLVVEAIRSSSSRCTFVIKRQRLTKHLYTIQLNLCGNRNHGLMLDNGIYISKIASGSLAAKEGNLAIGDRILSINNKSVEGVKSLSEATSYLDDNRSDILTIVVLKQGGLTSSSSSRSITPREARPYNKMINSCTQTEDTNRLSLELEGNRHFVPVTAPIFGPSPATTPTPSKSTSIITEMFQKFRDKINSSSHNSKYSASPDDSLSQESAAIAELDSILSNVHSSSKSSSHDVVLKRPKRKSKDVTKDSTKYLGTWPRANIIAHEKSSGTIVQHRKKERPSLSSFTSVDTPDKEAKKQPKSENYFAPVQPPPSSKSSNAFRNSNPIPYHVLSPPPSVINRHSVYKLIESENMPPPINSRGSKTLSRVSEMEHQHHRHHLLNNIINKRMSLNLTSPDNNMNMHNISKSPIGNEFKEKQQLQHQQQQNSEILDFISLKSQHSIDSIVPSKNPLTMEFYSKNATKESSDYFTPKKTTKSVTKYPSDSESLGPDSNNLPSNTLPAGARIQSLYGPHSKHQALFPVYGGTFHPHPHPHPHSVRHTSPYPVPTGQTSDSSELSIQPVYKLGFDNFVPVVYHSHEVSSIDYSYRTRNQCLKERDREDMSSYHGYEGGTFPRKKENQRLRIPSNPSVTSKTSVVKMSTSSIEHHGSERGSPMPSFQVEILSHGLNNEKRYPLTEWAYRQKPNPGDLRRVTIDKSIEPLGITIRCNNNGGGIFVSTVTENSIASQVGLQIGDQLLDVCGINMRSATYEMAANVLRQCGNSITMLVQYSPDKYDGNIEHISHDNEGRRSTSPSVIPYMMISNQSKPVQLSSQAKQQRAILPPQIKNKEYSSSLENQSDSSQPGSPDTNSIFEEEPRVLFIETKKCSNLGISLLGGNVVGIFVHSVQKDSLADKAGMRVGDQILEYNGTDLRRSTAEHAAYELAKPADKVSVIVQYNLQKFNQIKDKPGDSFYIRVCFDKTHDLKESELRFIKDDVLYVDNTMFRGAHGLWRAWKLDEYGHRLECGIISSQMKVEDELRHLGDITDGDGTARRGSTSARRSFFRRKKHQRSSSRDSKEVASFSNTHLSWFSDSGTLSEEGNMSSYQRVERLDYPVYRPVLVLGPLAECVVDKLTIDFPQQFMRCMLTSMNCTQEAMEEGLQNNIFVDYRRRGSIFECTTVQAIRDIFDKNRHCILDVGISAVERLQRLQIYPIVLLIRFRSSKQIKEIKDSRYSTDKISAKAAKEMYEHALKIESDYKQYISAVIPAGVNITHMSTQIKAAVDEEQKKILWVPSTV